MVQPLAPERTIPARNDGYQNAKCMRNVINYSDAVSTAVLIGTIPQNSYISHVGIYVETVFNAGTTNVFTMGTTSASANEIVSAADVSEASVGDTTVVRGLGMALTLAGDASIYVKYTQSGTAATTGRIHVCILYAPPNG